MIESIGFTNFKALRQATLPLSPFTLLLGPNGSGKSTVLQALQLSAHWTKQDGAPTNQERNVRSADYSSLVSATAVGPNAPVRVSIRLDNGELIFVDFEISGSADRKNRVTRRMHTKNGEPVDPVVGTNALQWLGRIQTFALDANAIAEPVQVRHEPLQSNGAGLAAVLDDLKDNHPDRWDFLLDELRHWLSEYDYVLFDKPQHGQKKIVLRTKKGGHRIPARELSQGTLLALTLLTLAHLPEPPSLIALEEIDRGLHPRLLRHLQDALYRLSYPESCGESRPPIQVIATTHSPYLLDLYREHPEEVVLAQKEGLEVQFNRLSDMENFGEILGDSPLSEVWYSGVLGGVSVKP